jgi:predicted nuclease of predicted toxin-antitoxin system
MSSDVIFAQIWNSARSLPARWKNLPENPFMVSAVFEDLLNRWSREEVLREFGVRLDARLPDEYPWANVTVMVAGEADIECARVARSTNSAILTSDSDLLVHDLGVAGSVVFLNSLQLTESTEGSNQASNLSLCGQGITPHDLCRHLGMPNIQRFAYELLTDPHAPFSKLLRLAKEYKYGDDEKRSVEYCDFLREYECGSGPTFNAASKGEDEKLFTQGMDPRVSELFWQFVSPETYTQASQFHVYLGVLHEDSSRRCAWEQSRFYRSLGYAILNLSRRAIAAHESEPQAQTVYEFVRRGTRIVAEQITLAGEKTVFSDLDCLQRRLDLARSTFTFDDASNSNSSSTFWFLFALAEVYHELSNTATPPTAKHLQGFLSKGFMGKATDWGDIHLLAQIQAVLYSLRMLQQLLQIAAKTYDLGVYRDILKDLPPLYLLMKSRHDMVQGFSQENCRKVVHQMIKTYG